MPTKKVSETISVLLISEQLAAINFIEKTLKAHYILNSHTSSQAAEIKTILSKETIQLVLIDDDKNNPMRVGAVAATLKQLRLSVPILQLQSQANPQADYLKNGAALVCPINEGIAIQRSVALLLSVATGNEQRQTDAEKIADFKYKFDEFYHSLPDPVCYLQDGFFVDANRAFLRAFEVVDKAELDTFSLLDFVQRKSLNQVKNHLRQSQKADLSASPVAFEMQTKLGKSVEFIALSKPAKFGTERAVQLYLRPTSVANYGGLTDDTTGLMNREQMEFTIKQHQEKHNEAILVYIFIQNYREIWANDGRDEAEKLIASVAQLVAQQMPAHAEISRYTDDAILCCLPPMSRENARVLLADMSRQLAALVPETMVRMMTPNCFISYQTLSDKETPAVIISQLFKMVRHQAQSEAGEVLSEAGNLTIAKSDAQRLAQLREVLQAENFTLSFQPIASFSPDKTARYQGQIGLPKAVSDSYTTESMVLIAERYALMHELDQWLVTQLLKRLLSLDSSQRSAIVLFIPISADALKQPHFTPWLLEQLQHTGLDGKHFVFELALDNIKLAYHGAKQFAEAVKQYGAGVAIQNLNKLTEENEHIIDEIAPSILKLDLREIDTLDEQEETLVMNPICEKAQAIQATLIADYLTSPAQLSRIWPYDISLIQGKGMTPILDDLSYDFSSLTI